jgi:RHS repeat-associated protein
MDDAGNRTSVTDGLLVTPYTPNNLNQYHTVDGINQDHDRNGNLYDDGVNKLYYDFANHLVQVDLEGSGGGFVIDKCYHRYDALGRRVALKVTDGFISPHNFWYSGQQILCQTFYMGIPTGHVLKKVFVYGIGIDEPVMLYTQDSIDADDDSNTTEWLNFFYHFNQLGSVMSITDYEGDVIERYVYDVYGEPTIYNKSDSEVTSQVSPLGNPFMFTGREWDGNYIIGLYHYRARAYNPSSGRFLQRDRVPKMNPYVYVRNRPTRLVDPNGQQPKDADDPPDDPKLPEDIMTGDIDVGDEEDKWDTLKVTLEGKKLAKQHTPFGWWQAKGVCCCYECLTDPEGKVSEGGIVSCFWNKSAYWPVNLREEAKQALKDKHVRKTLEDDYRKRYEEKLGKLTKSRKLDYYVIQKFNPYHVNPPGNPCAMEVASFAKLESGIRIHYRLSARFCNYGGCAWGHEDRMRHQPSWDFTYTDPSDFITTTK